MGMEWLFTQNNEADQTGACDSSLEAWTDADECTTISWNGSDVAATCGTGLFGTTSVLGCYPTADCETLGGTIPGTTDAPYDLACGATGLFASAIATIAVAASI